MAEQSHKDDMRAALRGDFDRLRERRARRPEVVSSAPESPGPEPVKLVLTPPQRRVEAAAPEDSSSPPAEPRSEKRSRLRMLFHRD